MATMNKELSQSVLQKAMKHRAKGAHDGGAVAEATILVLRQVNFKLAPVIGERGVNVLFKRSLHLTSRAFPWLIIAGDYGDDADPLTSLSECLAERDANEATDASSTLLVSFTELLESLIGESLAETLLGPPSGSLSLSSKQETAS